MPIVNITLIAGRGAETRDDLARRVTAVVSEALDIPPARVRVLLTEVPETHWFVGGVPLVAPPEP